MYKLLNCLNIVSFDYKKLDYCRRGTGLVRHPSRCDAFVECASNGHAVERFCGPTLYFNADKGVCDYQHLVKCQLLNNGKSRSTKAHADVLKKKKIASCSSCCVCCSLSISHNL
jgi:hypothetical protein